MMKIFLLTLTLLFFGWMSAYSQSDYGTPQFFYNLPFSNPGFAGIDDFLNVNLNYNQPWNNIDSDVNSFSFSVFGPVGSVQSKENLKRGSRVSNPDLINDVENIISIRRKHGLGLITAVNTVGGVKDTDFRGVYSYHLPVSKALTIGFGTSFGIYQQQVNINDLTVRDVSDIIYQDFINSEGQQTRLIADLGIALYSEKFYLGVNGNSLIDKQLSNNLSLENFNRPISLSVLYGMKFDISNKFRNHFNLGLDYSDFFGIKYMAATRVLFDDKVYLGYAYYHDFKMSFLIGFNIKDQLNLHYGYDSYSGVLQNFTAGSHQLNLSFFIFNNYFKKPTSW